jgi:hypothetical protein
MKKYQIRVRARRAGSRLENQKQIVTTLLEGGNTLSFSQSNCIQTVIERRMHNLRGQQREVYYGPEGIQRVSPWRTLTFWP